jgi:hypothetical protein
LAFGSPYILEKLPKHQRERIEFFIKVKRHLEILPGTIYYIPKQPSVPEGF